MTDIVLADDIYPVPICSLPIDPSPIYPVNKVTEFEYFSSLNDSRPAIGLLLSHECQTKTPKGRIWVVSFHKY